MTEERTRFQVRVSQGTYRKVQAVLPHTNCRSQNEFVERALQHYADYITTENLTDFLPSIYTSVLRATIQDSENRICRLLFKMAVEMDMMMNVLAAGMEIPEEDLERLRGRCVREVKATSGGIDLKHAVRFQRGIPDERFDR